ncbi:MAG: type II secretion system F family protein [Pseudomonadota bacterium]
MIDLNPDLMHAALIFLAISAGMLAALAVVVTSVETRLASDSDYDRMGIEGDLTWGNVPYRMYLLSRIAPDWIQPSEERAAEFDELFRSGGRPMGPLTGYQFLRACAMESVWITGLAVLGLITASLFFDISIGVIILVIVLAILLGGPNMIFFTKSQCREHATNVTREVPYFLDLLILVMQAGGNFSTTIDTFLRSVQSGSMRREVLLMRQQLSQGDAAALMQLAGRVVDPAVEQVIGTIAKGIETGGDPTRDAEQAERLRLIRSENAKATSKAINTKMIFVVFVAFAGVILSIFAAVMPVLSNFI